MTDKLSAELLIKEHHRLDDLLKQANKRFAEFCAPYKQQMESIEGSLLEMLNRQRDEDSTKASISTDSGTAYLSHLLNAKIDADAQPFVNEETGEKQVGLMALLDWCLANWDTYGADMLMIGNPHKDTLKKYMDENEGRVPPGVSTSWFTRVNVRRS